MFSAILRLFNAVPVDTKENKDISPEVLERTIRHGYILDPAIPPDEEVLKVIDEIAGISGEKANSSFHKSWKIVEETDMESLVIQQMIHYLTTYGFEKAGIYSKETVYIPREKLELPESIDNIPLTVIKAIDYKELEKKVLDLSRSGIALSEQSLKDIMTLVEFQLVDLSKTEYIENRELKARCNDYYGIAPEDPVEFLRYVISNLTDESLLIKNDYLIGKIKESNGKFLDELLKEAPDDLASIFFRFKPLFLAMKSISRKKGFFNRLRKEADKKHKPMPEDYLNNVTNRLKNNILDIGKLTSKLENASVFRKIRLAYALNFRLNADKSIVYRVRNGRGWADKFNWEANLNDNLREALDIVLASLAIDLRKNVAGKTFYIPANVHYAMPATEKQFVGNIPAGSFVSVDEDMIVGIHWTNTNKRVDLDLSVIGASGKIGWDAEFKSDEGDFLFSGDMTDAPPPDGASEFFYIKKGAEEPRIALVNFYNYYSGDSSPAKIIIAKENPENFWNNYMVDPANIIAAPLIEINRKQNVIGLIHRDNNGMRFSFAMSSIGNSITSRKNSYTPHIRKYLISSLTNPIDLEQVLTTAGATILNEKPKEGDYIDLSPEALDKSTFIGLLN